MSTDGTDTDDEEHFSFELLRTASCTDGSKLTTCFSCRESVGDKSNDLRLGCRCMVHLNCFVRYLKSIISDRMSTNALETGDGTTGIHCPNYNKNASLSECLYEGNEFYLMKSRDLIRVVEIIGTTRERGSISSVDDQMFTREDLSKLQRWLSEKSGGQNDNEEEISPIILHTTKACPKCKFRQSHFHGHACHSVVCGSCHASRCYRCGNESCSCGSSHGYCKEILGISDITDFLVLNPYPYDKRCGCAICFDCRPGKPCGTCTGSCIVCTGTVNPGPEEEDEDGWDIMTPSMRKAAEEYDVMHPVERLDARHQVR